jgi:hypothetical protein
MESSRPTVASLMEALHDLHGLRGELIATLVVEGGVDVTLQRVKCAQTKLDGEIMPWPGECVAAEGDERWSREYYTDMWVLEWDGCVSQIWSVCHAGKTIYKTSFMVFGG